MQTPLILIVALVISAAAAHGQTASGRIPKAKVVRQEPEAGEKKPTFFQRLFGPKTPKVAPTPDPVPEPTPTPRPRRRTRSAPPPEQVESPETPATPEAPETEPPTAPKKSKATPRKEKPKADPPTSEDKKPDFTGMSDAEKYKAVRKLAMEDEKVSALAAKASSALGDAQTEAATEEYNRALFQKIRQIEPSLDAYVDRVEAAMTRRLAAEKKRK